MSEIAETENTLYFVLESRRFLDTLCVKKMVRSVNLSCAGAVMRIDVL